jgi:hypothetical protein
MQRSNGAGQQQCKERVMAKDVVRFTRLNHVTRALLKKSELKNPESLHRALERLDRAEKLGMDFYDWTRL